MVVEEAEKEKVEPITKVNDLGRYRLIAELARGGMGIVYLALVRGPGGFNKLFVVKELKAHLTEDPNLVRMFTEEARLSAKLSHPNVVQTIEVGSDGARHFIAMEHLDGQSLNRVLLRGRKTGKPLPFPYFLHALSHMLEGLEYAHSLIDFDGTELRLVHRDVSPHNLFLTYDGQVKLLDFGIAKALDSGSDTRTGILKGKVSYMAPEQAAGQPIDGRADVFSAGVMLFEAVTGVRMWKHAQNDLQILHALMNGVIPKPRDAKPDLDPALERIILNATAVRREDRYGTAAEMQVDVDYYLKSMSAPPFGPRDLGKFVADAFAAERGRIKRVVDEQLRAVRGMGLGEHALVDLPRLTPGTGTMTTPSGVHLASASLVSLSGSHPGMGLEGLGSSAREVPTRDEGGRASRAPSAPPKRSPAFAIAIAAAAAVVLGAVLFLRMTPHAPPAAAPAPAAIAPPAPAAAAAASIRVLVTAAPRDATITVDGLAGQRGPFTGTFARDGAAHTIRIEAPKFQSKALDFRGDDDHTFDVSLEPVADAPAPAPAPWHPGARRVTAPPSAGPSPAPVAAPAPAAPAPAPAPAATGRTKQQIDTRDPYAQ